MVHIHKDHKDKDLDSHMDHMDHKVHMDHMGLGSLGMDNHSLVTFHVVLENAVAEYVESVERLQAALVVVHNRHPKS